MLSDTLSMEHDVQELYIVQIGDNITKGYTYRNFHSDSLRTHDPNRWISLLSVSVEETFEASRRGDPNHTRNNPFYIGRFTSFLYKDYNKNEIRVTDRIDTNNFVYTDEILPQDWVILSDTATILGYHSQKAQCHWRGREWVAWFTMEIPISEGPWKFYGLPGLITRLYDTKHHYSFELTGFQAIEEPISMEIPRDARTAERRELLRMRFGDRAGAISSMNMISLGVTVQAPQAPPRHYDFIEIDY